MTNTTKIILPVITPVYQAQWLSPTIMMVEMVVVFGLVPVAHFGMN